MGGQEWYRWSALFASAAPIGLVLGYVGGAIYRTLIGG